MSDIHYTKYSFLYSEPEQNVDKSYTDATASWLIFQQKICISFWLHKLNFPNDLYLPTSGDPFANI